MNVSYALFKHSYWFKRNKSIFYCLWKTIMKYLESEIFTNIMSLKWEIAPKCKDRLSFDSGKV